MQIATHGCKLSEPPNGRSGAHGLSGTVREGAGPQAARTPHERAHRSHLRTLVPGTRRTARATCEKVVPLRCVPTHRSRAARESGSARASAASKMSPPLRGAAAGAAG